MKQSFTRLALIVGTLALAQPGSVQAEQARFRFVPVDACGHMAQVPIGPNGALGEQLNGLGLRPQPFNQVFRPNQMVTFRHPYTGRNVTVPLTLPAGTPRIEIRADRVIYDYGAYVVEARFLPDGSVDTVYNSGFLRYLVVNQ